MEYEKLRVEKIAMRTNNGVTLSPVTSSITTTSHDIDDSDYSGTTSSSAPSKDEMLLAEAKALRQHKGKLECRMQILEDHNSQLESQLQRLRQLLETDPDAASRNLANVLNRKLSNQNYTNGIHLSCQAATNGKSE